MTNLEHELDMALKSLTIKDYRIELRARGLSPAGSQETLRQRLKENMLETKDFTMRNEDGTPRDVQPMKTLGVASDDVKKGFQQNNYGRPEGQNVGNFITDRSTSRVLAPPGGGSQILLGDDGNSKGNGKVVKEPIPQKKQEQPQSTSTPLSQGQNKETTNNYSRPSGQNVGNFLTDRPTSRVTNPPGGASNISFG